MRKVRMLTKSLLKGMQQSEMILARLQIAHGEDERSANSELFFNERGGGFTLDRPEGGGNRVGNHDYFSLVEAVMPQNRLARKLARRKDARGGLNGPPHRITKLRRSELREVLRMLQIADVVDTDDEGHLAAKRTGILHMKQVWLIVAELHRQV